MKYIIDKLTIGNSANASKDYVNITLTYFEGKTVAEQIVSRTPFFILP